ncbi:hypothetical protein [Yoonia sp. R2-816]|uniref:hypothetical protein n=1 Tax=Yoonia sp. R2-816 TaxID=3342638 RepID=UPI00372D58B6
MVFGETDTGVVDIIEFAQKMTLKQAQSLSKLRGRDAPATNSKVWQRWIKQNGNSRDGYIKDFDNVLSIGRSLGDSPIGSGLLLISRVIFNQAGKVDAEKAYAYEDDGTPFLADPWDKACSTLKDAALSFGASELCDKADIAEMRRPLRQVVPGLVKMIEDKVQK